jgi:cyclophilin family peptidyl-prolyl cis-trans isomerase
VVLETVDARVSRDRGGLWIACGGSGTGFFFKHGCSFPHFKRGRGRGRRGRGIVRPRKPQTVRNFLLYVRNGAYGQVLLHRLVPGFVLQGGGFTNADPAASTNLFFNYGAIRNLGTVTNEFGVGPRLSNTVGTIAMAKVGNDPNSATSQWFFNLGNNTNLDTQNGGFTVFGRVLPTTNAMAGNELAEHVQLVFTDQWDRQHGHVLRPKLVRFHRPSSDFSRGAVA